jgi:hypothetical protein
VSPTLPPLSPPARLTSVLPPTMQITAVVLSVALPLFAGSALGQPGLPPQCPPEGCEFGCGITSCHYGCYAPVVYDECVDTCGLYCYRATSSHCGYLLTEDDGSDLCQSCRNNCWCGMGWAYVNLNPNVCNCGIRSSVLFFILISRRHICINSIPSLRCQESKVRD